MKAHFGDDDIVLTDDEPEQTTAKPADKKND